MERVRENSEAASAMRPSSLCCGPLIAVTAAQAMAVANPPTITPVRPQEGELRPLPHDSQFAFSDSLM